MIAIQEISKKALIGLLKPIVRFALSVGVRYKDITDCLKLAFIKVAEEELEKINHQVSPSKLSAMTGIQRKEISRLLENPIIRTTSGDLITKIIGLWRHSKKYQKENGQTKVLDLKGRDSAFGKLVSQVSTDLNPYTVAFEMQRLGYVEETDKGLKLLKHGYEPKGDIKESLRLLSEDEDLLFNSVLENVFFDNEIKNLHVKTQYDNIPKSLEPKIRAWFLENGGKFHNDVRTFLSSCDRDLTPKLNETYPEDDSIKASICSYSFTKKIFK